MQVMPDPDAPNVVHVAFVFASGKRHTRWPRDWSSDVCSSDLLAADLALAPLLRGVEPERGRPRARNLADARLPRSEERRVGKERRSRSPTMLSPRLKLTRLSAVHSTHSVPTSTKSTALLPTWI